MPDQSVALDVKTPSFDASSPLLAAAQIGNQTALGGYYSALSQIERQQAEGQNIAYRDELVRNAAAHALDADSWDAAMRDAAQRGAPEAAQYIGRYTPLLQERLFGAYGGAGGGAGAGAAGAPAAPSGAVGSPTAQYDRAFQNATPEQMGTSLTRLNMISDALMGVRDQPSWNAAIARLQQAGIPQAAQFAGAYSPLQVQRLYDAIQPVRSYLQNRVAGAASGLPSPLVPDWKVTTVKDSFGGERAVAYDANNPARSMAIKPNAPGAIPGAPTADATNASPFTSFAAAMNQAESGGSPTARNPLSTATGAGQFINSTWLDTIKSARPDLVKGMTDQQILALRNDPVLSQEMTADYARANAEKLSTAGLPVTSATLALAHRFGPDGAKAILSAAPAAPLSEVLPKKVIDANPQLAGLTAGQYAQTMARQFGNTPLNAVKTPKLADFDMGDVNSDLQGWDYAKQFPIEVQAAARAFMHGDVMPTGNPRNQGIATMAKMVAQKVASDLGHPELADDTLYPQRRQMQVDLAKTTSPQAIGGQITFGGTALGHLAEYAADLADLHNRTGGITPIGHAENWLRSLGPEQAEKINQANGDAQHYGQEITKFYGGGPGGEAERSRFLATADPTTKTPQELAGIIRAERNLIPERYAQIRANIENVLGPEAAAKALARLDVSSSMDKINQSLARLDPNGPEAMKLRAATPPPVAGAGAAPAPAAGIAAPAPTKAALSPIDQQALAWANANQNDPRAAKIKQRLGAQ